MEVLFWLSILQDGQVLRFFRHIVKRLSILRDPIGCEGYGMLVSKLSKTSFAHLGVGKIMSINVCRLPVRIITNEWPETGVSVGIGSCT